MWPWKQSGKWGEYGDNWWGEGFLIVKGTLNIFFMSFMVRGIRYFRSDALMQNRVFIRNNKCFSLGLLYHFTQSSL